MREYMQRREPENEARLSHTHTHTYPCIRTCTHTHTPQLGLTGRHTAHPALPIRYPAALQVHQEQPVLPLRCFHESTEHLPSKHCLPVQTLRPLPTYLTPGGLPQTVGYVSPVMSSLAGHQAATASPPMLPCNTLAPDRLPL